MRDSIFYSSIRSLFVAFCAVIGVCLGFLAIALLLGVISGDTASSKLTAENTEEILPNAKGVRKVASATDPVILQINIDGIIGTEALNTRTIRQKLVESREGDYKDDRVKGIILNIDSPGGTVTDADGIFKALLEYKKMYKVPVYAYVDGLCASGGMYIALAADKIYSSDVSLIGSVGVIAPTFMNLTKLLEKVGVDTLTISAGIGKDAMNPLRPWKPGEEKNYKDIIEYYYTDFVKLVTDHRPLISKDKLVNEYGAHVFPAATALDYGYIDVSGALLKDALTDLLKQVGIENDDYQFIKLESTTWWKGLFTAQASLLTGKVKHELSLSPAVDLMMQNKYLYLYYPQ
jgi:protease IV